MNESLERVQQPVSHRGTSADAQWEYLPELGTVIGFGDGLLETLGEEIHAVRRLYFCYPKGSTKQDRRDVRSRIGAMLGDRARLGAALETVTPLVVTSVADTECTVIDFNDESGLSLRQRPIPHNGLFPLRVEDGYHLKVTLGEGAPRLEVVRRMRAVKRRERSVMAKFGIRPGRRGMQRGKRATQPSDVVLDEIQEILGMWRDGMFAELRRRLVMNAKRRRRTVVKTERSVRKQTRVPDAGSIWLDVQRKRRARRASKPSGFVRPATGVRERIRAMFRKADAAA